MEPRRQAEHDVAHLLRPYRSKILLVLVAVLTAAALTSVVPFLVRAVFDDALFPLDGGAPDLGLLGWLVAGMCVIPVVTALIGIDYEVVSEWAQRRRIPHTTYRDLSEKPEVIALVDKAVKETNEKFARVEQIKAFRLMTKELDHEDGELTATQKVKRSIIESRFSDLIESMYR